MSPNTHPLTLSVIIVNFNSSPFIKDCIDSLLRHIDLTHDEIIVVDNNSTDNSVSIIKKYKQVTCIQLAHNVGYGAGCNVGAKIAKGDILVCMNPDVQLLTSLRSVKNIFTNHPNCAIVAPVVKIKSTLYSPVWRLPTVFGEFLGDIRIFSRKYHLFDKIGNVTTVRINKNQFASGAALFIDKDTFDKVNGFNEKFFMYFEDADLFFTIHRLKYHCFLDTKSQISHLTAGSSINLGDKKIIYHYKSKYHYFQKRNSKIFFQVHKITTLLVILLKIILNYIKNIIYNNKNNKIKAYIQSIIFYLSAH